MWSIVRASIQNASCPYVARRISFNNKMMSFSWTIERYNTFFGFLVYDVAEWTKLCRSFTAACLLSRSIVVQHKFGRQSKIALSRILLRDHYKTNVLPLQFLNKLDPIQVLSIRFISFALPCSRVLHYVIGSRCLALQLVTRPMNMY